MTSAMERREHVALDTVYRETCNYGLNLQRFSLARRLHRATAFQRVSTRVPCNIRYAEIQNRHDRNERYQESRRMWNTVNMEIERFASKNRNQFSRGRWMREENFAKLVLLLRFFLFLFFFCSFFVFEIQHSIEMKFHEFAKVYNKNLFSNRDH